MKLWAIRPISAAACLVFSLFFQACHHDDDTPKPSPEGPLPQLPLVDMEGPIGGSRPVEVLTPTDHDPSGSKKYPLLILLHGFNSTAAKQDAYLKLSQAALQRGFVFAAPDGTMAPLSRARFWNAGEVCCNFENVRVDDIAYIRDLIRQITARYAVDSKKVYLFGHSNGAFMAHRFACDQSEWVTAIAGLAGSLRPNPGACVPARPMGVLTIHGTDDTVIKYAGGQFNPLSPFYPSAETTIARWARVNGCGLEQTRGAPFSIIAGSPTVETTALRFEQCQGGVKTELWKIEGGSHIPGFDPAFVPKVLDFFEAHSS